MQYKYIHLEEIISAKIIHQKSIKLQTLKFKKKLFIWKFNEVELQIMEEAIVSIE